MTSSNAETVLPPPEPHEAILAKLQAMGLALPAAPTPVAAYVPSVRTGNLVVVSGQLPFRDGQLTSPGRVPSVVPPSEAKDAAGRAALNAVAVLAAALGGDLGRVRRIVRVGVFVASDDGFSQQPAVANGASELLAALFGERGRHARAAVGVNALPLGASVEVELMAEVA